MFAGIIARIPKRAIAMITEALIEDSKISTYSSCIHACLLKCPVVGRRNNDRISHVPLHDGENDAYDARYPELVAPPWARHAYVLREEEDGCSRISAVQLDRLNDLA